jgi:Fur family ferric uptake transcriptional regulator
MSHKERRFDQRIREMGYRLTPQRQLILDAVCGIDGHATVAEICQRVQAKAPAVNRATVYRNLNFLCEIRLLVSGEIGGKTVYELADPKPHHHLVCRSCGQVEFLADHHFRELMAHLLEEHDFVADIDHLTISGLCADCQIDTSSVG